MSITVKLLKQMLDAYPDDKELYFNGLDFYRLKDRGPYVQFEFNQTVYRDTDGKIIVEEHKEPNE